MTSTTTYDRPVAVMSGSAEPEAPLVVLLHGRGSDEQSIIGLADLLPQGPAYAAVRAPIAEGGGYAWFANRGIGRPVAESLNATITWFRRWLDNLAPPERPVILVGFSGGGAAAGGLLLADPQRFAGVAILYGTLPFEAGLATSPDALAGAPVFVARGDADTVIPLELQQRTWAYLRGDSGALTTSHRDGGGHGLTQATLEALNTWLAGMLAVSREQPGHAVEVLRVGETPDPAPGLGEARVRVSSEEWDH